MTVCHAKVPSLFGTTTPLIQEGAEVTKIREAISEGTGASVEARPFRTPYHTISTFRLVGRVSNPELGGTREELPHEIRRQVDDQ